jgi:hypothetical protein
MRLAVFSFAGVGGDTITVVDEAHCRWTAARCVAAGGWMKSDTGSQRERGKGCGGISVSRTLLGRF